jgi:hypothetical protein
MTNENALLDKEEKLNEEMTETFDFDALEEKLQRQLQEEFADMQFLKEEKDKIGSPDNLGNVVMNVVWEQFLNQVAVTAGEDFVKENRGLHLDLRKDAHIQTTENFAKGNIATHNTEINFQERYDDWQKNFVKDENGNVVTHKTRSGKEEATLVKDARKPFDKDRPIGSALKHKDQDHTISAAEIIRDPAANAHLTKDEQIAFANSDANLSEMDSSLNRSKGDKSMTEWLDQPNAKGQKPDEIFDISAEDDASMRQKDTEAREEYKKQKEEGEKRTIEAGKKSRKEESLRITGKALRAVLMQLLAELVREIIEKLVKWFKSSKKALDTLLNSLKEAIHSFIRKMKTHLINAANTVFTTVATAIIGPVFATIKKVWMMLKQGWNSFIEAVKYIKNPANKGKPINIFMMEFGKIIVTGLTVIGSLTLGEAIQIGLETIPIFKFEIPLIGSLASILGILLGAVISGILGAIVINLIDKMIEKSLKRENINAKNKKGNEILNLQHKSKVVAEVILERTKAKVANDIHDRHVEAANRMAHSVENIRANCAVGEGVQDTFNDIDTLFNALED